MQSKVLLLAVGFVATALLLVPSVAQAAAEAEETPTYNEDIAPILNQRYVICHRPGTVAPMSLVSYKQTRPWARAIKEKVRTPGIARSEPATEVTAARRRHRRCSGAC